MTLRQQALQSGAQKSQFARDREEDGYFESETEVDSRRAPRQESVE